MSDLVTAAADLEAVRLGGPGEPFDPRSVVFTGSTLRKIRNGRGGWLIVKHIDPEGDWLGRATGGVLRPLEVFRSGLLRAIEPVVEHAVIGIVEFPDHSAVVMRDVSKHLWSLDDWLQPERVKLLLSRIATLHNYARGLRLPTLCTPFERANMCNPSAHEGDMGRAAAVGGAQALRGAIRYLAERAGGQAGHALSSFFDHLPEFSAEVGSRDAHPTLLHGDIKLDNVGVDDERLVAVDWGELTGKGPAEFDVVRFALGATQQNTLLDPKDIYALYDEFAEVKLDRDLLRLATLSCAANNGIGNLAQIQSVTDPDLKQRAKNRLARILSELRDWYP